MKFYWFTCTVITSQDHSDIRAKNIFRKESLYHESTVREDQENTKRPQGTTNVDQDGRRDFGGRRVHHNVCAHPPGDYAGERGDVRYRGTSA